MNHELKEKLIEIVRNYDCIYNPKQRDYKNTNYKTFLWEQIGASIGLTGPKAKVMWGTMRDGYIRYKKKVKRQAGSSKKYINHKWSSHMSFLDDFLQLRLNIPPSQERLHPPQSLLPEPIQPPPSTSSQLPPLCPSSRETQQRSQSQPSTSSSPSRTTRKNPGIDNAERDYGNKKTREWDSVDHLFMSYAKSFKELSVQNQGTIKVSLATMFAEAELDELENISSNEPNTSSSASVVYL